ncbi:hypothetical protein Pcaca04_32020 [Pectobacterium carotovorum subsp. carotovorum]|nr:hypothetical protein Pcaca04_32020 [Pectobacterium carotovorum subsp. carotovorum]
MTDVKPTDLALKKIMFCRISVPPCRGNLIKNSLFNNNVLIMHYE